MKMLLRYKFSPEESKYFDCSICLKSFEETPGEDIMQIPNCEHVFHEACLRRWFLQVQICPMCRGTIIRMPAHHSEDLAPHAHFIRQDSAREEAKEADLELGDPQPIDFSQPHMEEDG
jgi:hypothetical protein